MELWMLGIILLIAGFALIGVEMVVPGFGVPGISGIISLIVGICLTSDTIEEGLTVTMVVVVILAVMLTVFMLTMKKVKTPIVLEEHMKAEVGFLNASDLDYLVGKEGIASTDLKPAGKCKIDGVEFDVRSNGNYIKKGSSVRICRIHENTIIIEEL